MEPLQKPSDIQIGILKCIVVEIAHSNNSPNFHEECANSINEEPLRSRGN